MEFQGEERTNMLVISSKIQSVMYIAGYWAENMCCSVVTVESMFNQMLRQLPSVLISQRFKCKSSKLQDTNVYYVWSIFKMKLPPHCFVIWFDTLDQVELYLESMLAISVRRECVLTDLLDHGWKVIVRQNVYAGRNDILWRFH